VSARFTFRSGARTGQVETFRKAYIGLGRHPLSDVRFDPERDLDVSARHANIVRTGGRFVLRDLGSTNGTFVNGQRIAGDVVLAHGDVISFGQHGPAVEFQIIPDGDDAPSQASRESAGRMASPRPQYPAVTAPRPRALTTTAARIAAEVARQTRQLRRTTKVLIVGLAAALAAFTWVQWRGTGDARALARLEAGAERLQAEMATLRDALRESQLEVAQLRAELAAARTARDASAVARLRARLDSAETRQRRLAGAAGMDYRAIAENNQDAVALLVVAFSASEIISGTAFAVDSQGTLVTNKHVLVGEDGNRRPERLAVKFSGSRQWFPGRFLGVADSADVGLVKVDISGGTPRVAGLASVPQGLARGDPVAIIGYPLGEDLPMVHLGENDVVADPTLTVGTVSKVLPTLVQVDGYGAPGSSGSPIFDRAGRVVALLYGGNRESQGKIIFAVPASAMVGYLKSANLIK